MAVSCITNPQEMALCILSISEGEPLLSYLWAFTVDGVLDVHHLGAA